MHNSTQTVALANVLGRKFINAEDPRISPRPIDRKVAKAVFDGVTEASHAVGYGRTPFEVEMVVLDVWRAMMAERPTYNPSNNKAQRAWDEAFLARVADGLTEIA